MSVVAVAIVIIVQVGVHIMFMYMCSVLLLLFGIRCDTRPEQLDPTPPGHSGYAMVRGEVPGRFLLEPLLLLHKALSYVFELAKV